MNHHLHRGAELDLLEAARIYRQAGGPKLAIGFLDEYAGVLALLVEFPGLNTPCDEVMRVHLLHGFPFSVIHRKEGDGIRVLVVRSQYRDPERGESRL